MTLSEDACLLFQVGDVSRDFLRTPGSQVSNDNLNDDHDADNEGRNRLSYSRVDVSEVQCRYLTIRIFQ